MQAINYFVAQEYVQAMKAIGESQNSKLVMMPMETTDIISSVAGIAEMFEQTK